MNYTTGTITLTNGSAAVTGNGTGWATALIAGGVIYPQAAGNPLPIASVDSDTAITAATEWVGATGTYAYALQRQDDANQVIANAAALADYIQRLDNETLSALAGLTPAADKLAYFSGASTATLTTLTSFARSLLDDANASTALTTLGVSAFAKTLLDDTDASAALTTLGVSAFAKTLLDDIDASAARETLGAASSAALSNYLPVGGTAANASAVGGAPLSSLARAASDYIYGPNATKVLFPTGSSISMIYSNHVRFAWDDGFYYSIDGNNFVLINSLPSDAKFKDVIEDASEFDLAALAPVRWQRKEDIPVGLPEGDRLGFLAQDLLAFDPALVRETPVPDKSGETYLALADDAALQLIAHLWRTVCALSDRVSALEAAAEA
ncbi:MAG: hypothetical protein CMH13_18730 [Martelella sp.]|uniref:tail fiber domain-containing protein n=1 Tax=unclassified Martelella TaxID=2629616 RepID=UPI000C682E85|nr:tail fiber domain-containing protein [Martelella sp.]MAU22535.1 hypothetical protein [Martelella sp.]|tara:strand:- start:775 stop:1923 length:1149 start_codon:yes stop_codon:yes gene_type:complete